MSLMSNLYVGTSGLRTSQNALNTTAHNMSNIDTKGYTRQQVSQGTDQYITRDKNMNKNAWDQYGLGVTYNNTKQVRSVFLDQSYRLESGRQSFYDVSYQTMTEVEDLLQELNGTEFKLSLDNLNTAVQELSKNAGDATYQTQFVNRAAEFVDRSKAVYKGLQDYQLRMNNNVTDIVERINKIGDEIHSLNLDISRIEGADVERANDLRDRRNLLLDELGTLGDISYEEDVLNVVTVSFEGVAFVMTDSVHHMGLDTRDSVDGFYTPYWEFAATEAVDPGTNERYLDISSAKVLNLDLPVSSDMRTDVGKLRSTLLARGDHYATYHDIADDSYAGEIGGHYSQKVSQSIVMNVEAEFDQLFHNIVSAVNDVMQNALSNPATIGNKDGMIEGKTHTSDYTLFQVEDDTAKVRYDINKGKTGGYAGGDLLLDLSVTNTKINDDMLKEPSLFSWMTAIGEEDNAALEKLKNAFTDNKYTLNPNVSTRISINGYYNQLVSQVATSGSIYKSIKENQEVTVGNIRDAREQIHGVSQDEELQFMIQFQNAFNASSRYINVVSEMLDTLLSSLA